MTESVDIGPDQQSFCNYFIKGHKVDFLSRKKRFSFYCECSLISCVFN